MPMRKRPIRIGNKREWSQGKNRGWKTIKGTRK